MGTAIRGKKLNQKLKIYIAGPYSAKTEQQRIRNVNLAIDAGLKLFFKGHYPYIPHLTHFIDLYAIKKSIKMKWDDYIHWDLPWLEFCDAILYLGKSNGADLELERAKKLGKKVFYLIEEIYTVK